MDKFETKRLSVEPERPTLLTAILDLFPDLLPFLSPLKGLLANDANLFREIDFLVSHRVERR